MIKPGHKLGLCRHQQAVAGINSDPFGGQKHHDPFGGGLFRPPTADICPNGKLLLRICLIWAMDGGTKLCFLSTALIPAGQR